MPSAEQVLLFLAGAIVVLIAGIVLTRPGKHPDALDLVDDTLVFLIGGGRVIDANFQARRVIDRSLCTQSEFDQLRLFLSQHFDDAQRLLTLGETGEELMVQSRDGQFQATKQVADGMIRLKVHVITSGTPSGTDIHTMCAIECELETLRANTSAAPFLLWRQNTEGEVVWANKAYLSMAYRLNRSEEGSWPLPTVFPSLKETPAPSSREARRISLSHGQDEETAWYDCHISPVG